MYLIYLPNYNPCLTVAETTATRRAAKRKISEGTKSELEDQLSEVLLSKKGPATHTTRVRVPEEPGLDSEGGVSLHFYI